jgi:hypothetical protein
LLLAGSIGMHLTKLSAVVQEISFLVNGERVIGILYLPSEKSANETRKYPIVFLLPGIFTPAESFGPMAQELTRRNYAACILFIPTERSKFNRQAVVEAAEYIKNNFPQIDSEKRAIFGHSLGASTAMESAYYVDNVYAVVGAGYCISGELKKRPGNFLLGTGLYDDLNGPEKLKIAMATFDEDVAKGEGHRLGSFENKTALEMYVSPNSNHASESVDYYIFNKLFNWLDMSFFGKLQNEKPLIYHYNYLSIFTFLIGTFLFFSNLGIIFLSQGGKQARIIWLIILFIFPFLLHLIGMSVIFCFAVFGVTFLSCLASNYFLKDGAEPGSASERFMKSTGKTALYIFLFYAAFVISRFLFSIPIFLSNNEYVKTFPGYIFVSFFLAPCNIVRYSMGFLFHFYPVVYVILTAFCLAWFLIEFKKPGLAGILLTKYVNKIRNFVKFEKGKEITKKQKIEAAVLVVLGILSWFWIYKIGLLNDEVLKPYISFLSSCFIAPCVIWIILIGLIKKLTNYHSK